MNSAVQADGTQGGEGGGQGDADYAQPPIDAGGLVAEVRWGAKHGGLLRVGCDGPGLRRPGRRRING